MFALQNVAGKDKGLVATQLIPSGTRILCERPILRIPGIGPSIQRLESLILQRIQSLDGAPLSIFLSLRNIYDFKCPSEQYMGIVRTNGLPIGDDEAGIFEHACRINHACDNNAQKHWNENIQRHTVHALRDIQQGEEVTVFYLHTLESRSRRQAYLKEKFLFTCRCRLCALEPKKSRECDVRLEAILRLEHHISRGGTEAILKTPLQMLRYVDEQVRLYEQHGPGDAGLARAFFDAAQIVASMRDLCKSLRSNYRAHSRRASL